MAQLEHTAKQYMDGQLTAMNMRAMSCQTIQAQFSRNSGRDNVQFLVWPVHRTFARQLEQICRVIRGHVFEMIPSDIQVVLIFVMVL